jgi:hypothetical protein
MNRINIKRLGGLGDVVMILSIAKFLFNRGYTIDFTTGGHLTSFLKYQNYIDTVNEVNNNDNIIDFEGIEHDTRFCDEWMKNVQKIHEWQKDPSSEVYIRYVNSILGGIVNRSELEYDIKYPSEYRDQMMFYLNNFPRPWIVINTTSSIANRSIPISIAQEVQSLYNGSGTIFWIGNNDKLLKNNIVDVFGNELFYYITAIDCCDLLVSSNTSSLHFGFAFNKNIVSIEQAWHSKEYAYNTKSNIVSINVDLECLNCKMHGGCALDNRPDFNVQWKFSSYPKCSYISSTKILAAINEFKQY